jgi:hypothetical protein
MKRFGLRLHRNSVKRWSSHSLSFSPAEGEWRAAYLQTDKM